MGEGQEKRTSARIRGIFMPRHYEEGEGDREYWFARETQEALISIQKLDKTYKPTGKVESLPKEEFLRTFTLEPNLWYKLVTQRVGRGDYFREQAQYLEAKIEYNKVLDVDTTNIRAIFGLGLCYLALDQLDKAAYVFEKLLLLDETFSEEHKHLFNEFGIALRKKRLFAAAVRYYGRALKLSADDDHLYLNMARAHFESGAMAEAFDNLRKALALNAENRAALAFLKFLHGQKLWPQEENCAKILASYLDEAMKISMKQQDC